MLSSNYHLKKSDYQKTSLAVRILHNLRELKTKNSVFNPNDNDGIIYGKLQAKMKEKPHIKNKELLDIINTFLISEETRLQDLIKEKTKRKSQMELHMLETVISFSEEEYQSIKDNEMYSKNEIILNKIRDYYIMQGVKIYSINIHRDEGHSELTGEKKINNHIHVIHSNVIENTGKSWLREQYSKSKEKKQNGLANHQDELCGLLDFKRGISKEITHRQHLDYKDYKKLMQYKKNKDILNTLETFYSTDNKDVENVLKSLEIIKDRPDFKDYFSVGFMDEYGDNYKQIKDNLTLIYDTKKRKLIEKVEIDAIKKKIENNEIKF